jgi:hypothetical protein
LSLCERFFSTHPER